uniref:C2H2-type domain-containing protein n=1 Tax=Lotharella globosa TaxID=91324 RepID=A0A7S3YZ88_9EUKA
MMFWSGHFNPMGPVDRQVVKLSAAGAGAAAETRARQVQASFGCRFCNYTSEWRANVKAHERRHTGDRPFVCTVCNRSFQYKNVLTNHWQALHSYGKSHVCEICGKRFSTLGSLTSHKGVHSDKKDFKCKICGKEFRIKWNLETHLLCHAGWKPYECTQCKARFRQMNGLVMHQRIHEGLRPYECEECGRLFRVDSYLRIHRRTHTKERPFECTQCTKKFTQREALNRHIRTHTGEKPYNCSECGRRFNVRSSLIRHLRIHGEFTIHNCTLCDRIFLDKGRYLKHIAGHLMIPHMQCIYCTAAFPEEERLDYHSEWHDDLTIINRKARDGDGAAMTTLFQAYHLGIMGCEKNIATAMHCLREAVKLGNIKALVFMAVVKILGLFREYGENPDPHLGAILLARAAYNSSVEGTYFLAQCYRYGLGVQQNHTIYQKVHQAARDLEAESQPCMAMRDFTKPVDRIDGSLGRMRGRKPKLPLTSFTNAQTNRVVVSRRPGRFLFDLAPYVDALQVTAVDLQQNRKPPPMPKVDI